VQKKEIIPSRWWEIPHKHASCAHSIQVGLLNFKNHDDIILLAWPTRSLTHHVLTFQPHIRCSVWNRNGPTLIGQTKEKRRTHNFSFSLSLHLALHLSSHYSTYRMNPPPPPPVRALVFHTSIICPTLPNRLCLYC
jgi:hypothetical protein